MGLFDGALGLVGGLAGKIMGGGKSGQANNGNQTNQIDQMANAIRSGQMKGEQIQKLPQQVKVQLAEKYPDLRPLLGMGRHHGGPGRHHFGPMGPPIWSQGPMHHPFGFGPRPGFGPAHHASVFQHGFRR